MKQKRKNDEPPFSETPVGSCCYSIAKLVIIGFGLWVLAWVFYIVFTVFQISYREHQFIEKNTPLVQTVIQEECVIPNYIVEGWFDDSTMRDYYHFGDEFDIRCELEETENWQCTCTEQE